jgi:NAD(P)-dependent dehydrogenase (short-subunit alcohol dehydrogenase family)
MSGIGGRRALVTGRETILGTAIADRLVSEGAELVESAEPLPELLVAAHTLREDGAFLDFPDADWRRLLEQNLLSTARLVENIGPRMAGGGYGRIVVLSAEEGLRGSAAAPAFAASTGALVAFVRSAARALAPSGVAVNAVAAAQADDLAADVAGVVALLCSKEAEALVGQVLQVNRGTNTAWA